MENLLFTGASGFLGTSIKPILLQRYAITTIGLTSQDDYQIDFAKNVPNLNECYDIVLHAAGKAHSIPKTEKEEKLFYDINLQGTKNICAALEKSGLPRSFIFISTAAVYGLEFGENITEEYPLNGNTPYALSKIQAEAFLAKWCSDNNVILSIIRPSLIAGPNPPGNLGDMIRGIKTNRYLSIGKGSAKKSILMMQDIANLIPKLVDKGGIYNLSDSHHPTFRELEKVISTQLNKKTPLSIPLFIAKLLAMVGDMMGKKAPINSLRLRKITESLTFSNDKAKRELNWEPLDVLAHFKIK